MQISDTTLSGGLFARLERGKQFGVDLVLQSPHHPVRRAWNDLQCCSFDPRLMALYSPRCSCSGFPGAYLCATSPAKKTGIREGGIHRKEFRCGFGEYMMCVTTL